jgi:hypothetical protein
MWLDRCELVLREQAARMLLGTAKAGGRFVQTKELAQLVAPKRADDAAVRQVARKLGGWIALAFAKGGRKAPADVGEIVEWVRNKGWRMTVKCAVV